MYDKSRRRRRTLAGWNLLVCFSHFEADVAFLPHPSTGADCFRTLCVWFVVGCYRDAGGQSRVILTWDANSTLL